ncbi:fork head domain-containing protein crocodile-like [Teleopsis dalmanni]|uniref:fork head domain-containing protein crocodile-like n=1 Tax=Teleopsis dalmanni TaxID=139649 RepID=UPI0018CFA3E7|nr:fork head domain-containing protein crocodile-like [Teleopsis dalmanni]
MLISETNNLALKSTTSAVELSNDTNNLLCGQAPENICGDIFQRRIATLNETSVTPQSNNITHFLSNNIGSCRSDENTINSFMQTTSIEQYKLQLYNYAVNIERLRNPHYSTTAAITAAAYANRNASLANNIYRNTYNPGGQLTLSIFPPDILQSEEPKPQQSYIGLIAMAILNSSELKLVLSDIYQYILNNYPYFRTRGPGWRNSIRHNLSLNDCFIKSGRSANGKGHYWSIHPANVEDFRKGDFRRRKAQRKVRKHMGKQNNLKIECIY